ncbi:MAG: TAXI family TRAP transporter solute-binding subunit [Bacteriovorax sp.]
MDKKFRFAFPLAALIFIALVFVVRRIDPAPPNHLTIAVGDEQSDIRSFVKQYQRILRADGVTLEVRSTTGPFDSLGKLEDDSSGVSAAFVQDGLGGEDKQPSVESLGSLNYEPIWIFYRSQNEFTYFSQFMGEKIAVGRLGHGTQVLAERLLTMSGLEPTEAELINMNSTEAAAALKKGQIGAAIFMLPADSPIIHDLAVQKDLKLMDVAQAEAISRRDAAFHHLVLPRGSLDLESDAPHKDINLVASTTTLLVRDDLHPALAYLLLKAAKEVHSSAGIFEKKGEFPNNKDDSFSLSKDAVQFYKSGGPFWQRYLPYWLAAWFDRFILLVIPMLAFVLPLIRTIPKLYHWRLRTKIYQRYGELKFLETQIKADATKSEREYYLQQINQIEERVNKMKMPQNFSEYIYSLKGHIQYVRDRVERIEMRE